MKKRLRSKRALLGKLSLCAMAVCIVDVLVSVFLFRDGEFRGDRLAPFEPPLFSQKQREYLERCRSAAERPHSKAAGWFDVDLGWGPNRAARNHPLYRYDWSGSRIGNSPLPRTTTPGVKRVVAIGSSFTRGDEVTGPETWAAWVERMTGDVEVANLGIGGYGLDQALLRLQREGPPIGPDEVWCGFLPWACLRVTTAYPLALRHSGGMVAFKPMFSLGRDGELVAVPSPAGSLAEVVELIESQSAFLDAVSETDLWVRRSRSCYESFGDSWWHYSSIGRVIQTARESSGRDPRTWLSDPESQVFALLVALLEEMRCTCNRLGAEFRLLILPGRTDLREATSPDGAYWGAFVRELESRDFMVWDAAPALRAARAEEDDEMWTAFGHYSGKSHRLVAESIVAHAAAD